MKSFLFCGLGFKLAAFKAVIRLSRLVTLLSMSFCGVSISRSISSMVVVSDEVGKKGELVETAGVGAIGTAGLVLDAAAA